MDNDYRRVLFIKMTDGHIDSIEDQHRKVYTNIDGSERIKTTSDGVVPLDSNGVAVLSYKHFKTPRGYRVRRKTTETPEAVKTAINEWLTEFSLSS